MRSLFHHCSAKVLVRLITTLILVVGSRADASGLVSGHYVFRARYAPVCLNGIYPITIGYVTSDSQLTVTANATGQLTGNLDLRGLRSNFTGNISLQTNYVLIEGQTTGFNPTGRSSYFFAYLHGRQFLGDAEDTSTSDTTRITMDVSLAAPLIITFDVNLTVNGQGQVSGSGTASSCSGQTPVNITGTNTANSCSLHIVGTSLPQFTWDGSGSATSFGFVATWSAQGYGFTPIGAQLPIFAPNAAALVPYVVSRKNHIAPSPSIPAFTAYDLPMNPGVECRTGGLLGIHQLVIMFPKNITLNPPEGTAAVRVSSGIGSVNQFVVSNDQVIVNLTGVADAQTITVTLSQVSDGTNTADVVVPAKFLLGDTNGNGAVNSTDVSQTKLQSGQGVTNANSRNDINLSGSINATDVSVVKTKTGTALP